MPEEEEFAKAKARFMRFVRKQGGPGCWSWIGRSKTQKGYGVFHLGRKVLPPGTTNLSKGAHAAAHFLFNDRTYDFEADLQVHHKCGDTSCVNPAHLTVLTRSANSIRKRDEVDNVLDKLEAAYPEAAEAIGQVRAVILATFRGSRDHHGPLVQHGQKERRSRP